MSEMVVLLKQITVQQDVQLLIREQFNVTNV
jgi:hypothetical protein